MGFFLLPVIFVAYELAVEQTVKDGVGDSLSCGIINVATNTISFIVAFALTYEADKETIKSNDVVYSVLLANLVISVVLLVIAQFYRKKEDAHK